MLKILSTDQIRQADSYTIENEPISSIDLMERAAKTCFDWILTKLSRDQHVHIFCGQGNNGGDGLVIARFLSEKEFGVTVYSIQHTNRSTPDFQANMERLLMNKNVIIKMIQDVGEIEDISPNHLIIDAMLGSGLSKPVTGLLADCIHRINNSKAVVISIDVPTGLFCDQPIDAKDDTNIIKADYTLTFQTPRLSFLFPENEIYVGEWLILPIGLDQQFIQSCDTIFTLIEKSDISQLIQPRKRFGHKGTYGHGLLIAGSYGKMGAAILGSKAALRSGAGLITTHIPAKGYEILQTSVPEAMVSLDESRFFFSSTPKINTYNAIAAGPGLGTSEETSKALKLLIQNSDKPLILDADALNILSENKTWLAFLPKGSILTPHFKEFERLTHKVSNSFERIDLQRELSIKYGLYIILKGANSSISLPDGRIFFNPTGNPGMATGGSGDVLTGILLGLLAQNYSPMATCLISTYLHGLAGDIAAQKKSMESMIAGDIVDALSDAYKTFH